MLLTALSLKSAHQVRGLEEGSLVNVGEQEIICTGMRQLFHVFKSEKDMRVSHKIKCKQRTTIGIFSAELLISPEDKKIWLNNEAARGSLHRLIGPIGTL